MVKVSVWMRRKEARDQGGAQESDTNFPRRKNRDSIKGGEDENCTHTHYALCSAIWMKLLFTGLVTDDCKGSLPSIYQISQGFATREWWFRSPCCQSSYEAVTRESKKCRMIYIHTRKSKEAWTIRSEVQVSTKVAMLSLTPSGLLSKKMYYKSCQYTPVIRCQTTIKAAM